MAKLVQLLYFVLTLVVLYGEALAIIGGHNVFTHIFWLVLLVWNSFVITGIQRRSAVSRSLLLTSSYLQILVILVGYIAMITGIGYSMEMSERNVTHAGSFIVVAWALLKLSLVKRHYENT